MPLTLPKLDDRTWKDLIEEGRLLIPTLAPNWTNHNVSDPGITLVELFAFYCESFLYRLDQVSDANVRAFLTLINGTSGDGAGSTRSKVRQTLRELQQVHRAVSAEDFEYLALSANEQLPADTMARIARAKCIPRRNLEQGRHPATADAPGHVTVVVVPKPLDAPFRRLQRAVEHVIEPARLVATRVHIVPPRYLQVGVRVSVILERDVAREAVRKSVTEALQSFLDPLHGGADGKGWPFGRNVYVSEIYRLLAKLPGVRSVEKLHQGGREKALDELIVDGAATNRLHYNSSGELEAVELEPDELVRAELKTDQLVLVSDWANPASVRG